MLPTKLLLFSFNSQVVISLQKTSTNASLSLVRFFVRENPSTTIQTPHYTSPSTSWIVSEDEQTTEHDFNEVCTIFVRQVTLIWETLSNYEQHACLKLAAETILDTARTAFHDKASTNDTYSNNTSVFAHTNGPERNFFQFNRDVSFIFLLLNLFFASDQGHFVCQGAAIDYVTLPLLNTLPPLLETRLTVI